VPLLRLVDRMPEIRKVRDWVVENWPVKLTALVLATVLWAVVAAQETTTQLVPVTLEVQPPEGRGFTSELPQVQARYAGTLRELIKLYESPPTIRKSIPDTITGTSYTVELGPGDLETIENANVVAQEVQPHEITITLDDVVQRSIRVVSRVRIVPDSAHARFGDIIVLPSTVTARGPEALVGEIRSISTITLDTGKVRSPLTLTVPLDTSGLGAVRVEPASVQVSAEIGLVGEQVIMGVAVSLPGPEWESSPSAVIVTVRGPSGRVINLTRDSVRVVARPNETAAESRVPLRVMPLPGITARVRPDSATVRRRAGG